MWRGAVSDEPQCTRRARDVLRRIYFEAEPLLQRHTATAVRTKSWPLRSSSQIEAKMRRLPRRSEAARWVRLVIGAQSAPVILFKLPRASHVPPTRALRGSGIDAHPAGGSTLGPGAATTGREDILRTPPLSLATQVPPLLEVDTAFG